MGLRRAVASALIAIAVAAPGVPAHAASEAVPDQTISGLDLTAIPSVIVRRTDKLGRLTGNYYPEVAYEEHIGGLAVIDCQVSPKGDLGSAVGCERASVRQRCRPYEDDLQYVPYSLFATMLTAS